MTNKLALAIEIAADPAKAKAGLQETRKELLTTYADAKASVAKYAEALDQAKTRAADMARSMGTMGPPTKAMVADFERAKTAVNATAAAVEKQTAAMQQARLAARENAEAIQAAERAERQLAASAATRAQASQAQTRQTTIASSINAIGGRSNAQITGEIAAVNRAVASLRASSASASEIARASQLAQAKIAALIAELNNVPPAARGADGSLSGAAHRMAAMAAAALAAREGVQLLQASVSTGVQFDSLKTQYAFGNGGDVRKAAEEMGYAAELSNRLGLELVRTTQAYGKTQAAARGTTLEGQKTRDIFTAIASAGAVMGLTAEQQEGALLAITQMMSKGTVSAEELRGQLGERLPGAFQIAAKAMNVTTAELQKMLEAGQLTAEQFLPRFAEALQASVNGALPTAEASARANLQRLENAFTEFKLRIANSGLLDRVSEQLERLLNMVGDMADSGELDRLAKGFADTFGAIIKFLADATIFATQFADTLGPLATGLAAVMVGGRALALLGASAPALAATGSAATAAATGVGLLAGALRLLRSLTIGGVILLGAEALIEWGAKATEARVKAQAITAELQELIASNNEHASAARLDADALAEFGDEAFAAYQKAVTGARDYAAAKVVQLTRDNKDGKFDGEIAQYRDQAAAYNAYIDGVLKGEKLRREQAELTGQLLAKEAQREKALAGEVKQTRAEAVAEQIKDYERLVEAIGKAREEGQKEGEEARKRATDFRASASDKRLSANDKATQLREKDLAPEVRQMNDVLRAKDAQSQGSYYAAAAAAAQLDGRGKDFEKYTKEAEKFLDRAMKFAEAAEDPTLIEDIGKQQSNLDLSKAADQDAKAKAAEQQAAAMMEQINTAQAKVKELKGEAATIAIDGDITAIMNKLAEVEARIAKMPPIPLAGASTAPADTRNMTREELIDAIPGRAFGGPIPGYAAHDRADNVIIRATPGEFMVQRPTVKQRGARAFLADFNVRGMAAVRDWSLRGYAFGGEIGGSAVRHLSVPSLSAAGSPSAPDVLDLGELGRIRIRKTDNTADDVAGVIRLARLRYGRD